MARFASVWCWPQIMSWEEHLPPGDLQARSNNSASIRRMRWSPTHIDSYSR